jgi:hypothetical protein
MRSLNAEHELRVYQQGLSTRLSRGRGHLLDSDLRKYWYGHSLAKALNAHSNYKRNTCTTRLHQPDLW